MKSFFSNSNNKSAFKQSAFVNSEQNYSYFKSKQEQHTIGNHQDYQNLNNYTNVNDNSHNNCNCRNSNNNDYCRNLASQSYSTINNSNFPHTTYVSQTSNAHNTNNIINSNSSLTPFTRNFRNKEKSNFQKDNHNTHYNSNVNLSINNRNKNNLNEDAEALANEIANFCLDDESNKNDISHISTTEFDYYYNITQAKPSKKSKFLDMITSKYNDDEDNSKNINTVYNNINKSKIYNNNKLNNYNYSNNDYTNFGNSNINKDFNISNATNHRINSNNNKNNNLININSYKPIPNNISHNSNSPLFQENNKKIVAKLNSNNNCDDYMEYNCIKDNIYSSNTINNINNNENEFTGFNNSNQQRINATNNYYYFNINYNNIPYNNNINNNDSNYNHSNNHINYKNNNIINNEINHYQNAKNEFVNFFTNLNSKKNKCNNAHSNEYYNNVNNNNTNNVNNNSVHNNINNVNKHLFNFSNSNNNSTYQKNINDNKAIIINNNISNSFNSNENDSSDDYENKACFIDYESLPEEKLIDDPKLLSLIILINNKRFYIEDLICLREYELVNLSTSKEGRQFISNSIKYLSNSSSGSKSNQINSKQIDCNTNNKSISDTNITITQNFNTLTIIITKLLFTNNNLLKIIETNSGSILTQEIISILNKQQRELLWNMLSTKADFYSTHIAANRIIQKLIGTYNNDKDEESLIIKSLDINNKEKLKLIISNKFGAFVILKFFNYCSFKSKLLIINFMEDEIKDVINNKFSNNVFKAYVNMLKKVLNSNNNNGISIHNSNNNNDVGSSNKSSDKNTNFEMINYMAEFVEISENNRNNSASNSNDNNGNYGNDKSSCYTVTCKEFFNKKIEILNELLSDCLDDVINQKFGFYGIQYLLETVGLQYCSILVKKIIKRSEVYCILSFSYKIIKKILKLCSLVRKQILIYINNF